ncbi:hypothetical protein OURE66S_00449 [Oligella ureolytica]
MQKRDWTEHVIQSALVSTLSDKMRVLIKAKEFYYETPPFKP